MNTPGNPYGNTAFPQPISYRGQGLLGPECVLAERSGVIWTTFSAGGLSCIEADGQTRHIVANFVNFESDSYLPFTPNGFCQTRDHDFLIADMAGRRVIRMSGDGTVMQIISESANGKLGQINYVHRDHLDRIWIVEQSRLATPDDALNPYSRDGSILLYEPGEPPRTVASGLMHPNQIAVSADGRMMYVPQTTARNILSFRVSDANNLEDAVVVGPKDHGALIDGVALDSDGGLWGTHAGTDRIFNIAPDGQYRVFFEDPASIEGGAVLYDAFLEGTLSNEHINKAGGTVAPLMTSIAFAGPDLRTILVGSLGGKRLPMFTVPVAGEPPAHWSDDP